MAAPGNTWVETKPEAGEHFLQGIHLQSDGWDGPAKYEYIPDSRVLESSKVVLEKGKFSVNTLVHATTPEAAAVVLVDGFKPTRKNLGPNFPKGYNNLIWWGTSPEKKHTAKYSQQCGQFTKTFMMEEHGIALPDGNDVIDDTEHPAETNEENEGDSLASDLYALEIQGRKEQKLREKRKRQEYKELLNENFCSSPPFCITSRYGNVLFEYNIDQLLKAYSLQYCHNEDPAFLVLGTYAYKQEVMHTIIVCPKNETKLTRFLPYMDKSSSAIYKADDHWVWRPESTGSSANYYTTSYRNIEIKQKRLWEHAAFAFFVPDYYNEGLKLDNLDMLMTYCPPSSMFRLHTTKDDRKKWTINQTMKFFHDKHIMDSNFFLGFIHKCLVNNWKKEDKQYEGDVEYKGLYMKLNTSHLERLLGGFLVDDQSKEYDPDELLESVRDPAECKERWQLWIRQIAHYLLTD